MSDAVRDPACPGRFYPARPERLREMVRSYLDDAGEAVERRPRAVIAPHAGYVYSGAVAGHAFAPIRGWAEAFDRVVLIGPSHFVRVDRPVAAPYESFRTPLGDTGVDRASVEQLLQAECVEERADPHRREHSLETHVPFVQSVFEEIEIVPIVTGRGDGTEVAELLEEVAEGSETLVSVSSDLSHYLDYESAREVDDRTRRAIESFEADAIEDRQACGHSAIRGLLRWADDRNLDVETLAMCNSGDTAGDRSEVVGYGAWMFVDGRE